MSSLATTLQHLLDHKTKPIGALGRLEQLALQLGLIQQSTQPVIRQPHIVVFAADHGIAATGLVNPYPQAVTAQMVLNFVNGGAAINVLCRLHQLGLSVVDAGVAFQFEPTLPIIHAKIAAGTADYRQQSAMATGQVQQAITWGRAVVQQLTAAGTNCLGFGEMGIGNSSSAALLMHHYTGLPLEQCVGKGTGTNPEQYQQKLQTLQQVAHFHQLGSSPLPATALLEKIGGYEIAMMTGAYLQAADDGCCIVVDGFIATAALLCALQLQPAVRQHCVFAHCSHEQGHGAMLQWLQASPLLQLDMRLGEGTGAAMAIPVLRSACAILAEMASFESAGVSTAS